MSQNSLDSNKLINTVLGCIWGGAIGDSFGGPYEGKLKPYEINYEYPMHLSDDTQLTLATCQAITNNKNCDPESIANTFVEWYRRKQISGIGASTYKALQELSIGAHWALVGRKGEMAAGNGAAMRIAPLAFIIKDVSENNRNLIRDISRITHHNEEAYVGALAIICAIKEVVSSEFDKSDSLLKLVTKNLPDSRVKDRMIDISKDEAKLSITKVADNFGASGYVVDSVPLAIFSAHKIINGEFIKCLEELVLAGGDTDTNASMTCQIAGAYLGLTKLPISLFENIINKEMIDSISEQFSNYCRNNN